MLSIIVSHCVISSPCFSCRNKGSYMLRYDYLIRLPVDDTLCCRRRCFSVQCSPLSACVVASCTKSWCMHSRRSLLTCPLLADAIYRPTPSISQRTTTTTIRHLTNETITWFMIVCTRFPRALRSFIVCIGCRRVTVAVRSSSSSYVIAVLCRKPTYRAAPSRSLTAILHYSLVFRSVSQCHSRLLLSAQ